MVDEDLEVVKIPFAVIAPGPREGLFNIRVLALRFTHGYSIKWCTQRSIVRSRDGVGRLRYAAKSCKGEKTVETAERNHNPREVEK